MQLIVSNEKEIEVISKQIEQFKRIGIKVVIQSAMVLEKCLDKYKTMI